MTTTHTSRTRRFTAGVLAAGALAAAGAGIGVSAGTASAAPQTQQHQPQQQKQQQKQQNNRDRVITIHRPNLRPFNYRGHRVTPRYDRAHRAWGFYDGRTFVKIIVDRR